METNLFDLSLDELKEFVRELGEPAFRGKQIFEWIYRGAESFDDMTNISKTLREKLAATSFLGGMSISEKYVSKIDETRKYLIQLNDGNFIESVLMKYDHGYTICVSSQVGCKMGCKFCASTVNGWVRNLTPGEIIGQILCAQKDLGQRISNVVMMGIGEPFDNFDNVLKSIQLMNSPDGLRIGQRHISVSTCGLADKIRELAEMKMQITLLISLHAPSDERRSQIMPINNRFDISELISACDFYIKETGRRISFEYTLISGVNDNIDEADRLAALVKGKLCHVNLIPINKVTESGFSKSSKERIEEFRARLEKHGVVATIRRELGSDINAACGQLRNKKSKN